MTDQSLGLPNWVESLLLGNLGGGQRARWMALLTLVLLLVPVSDYTLGRGMFHLNLYPIPVILSIFLFGEAGLLSVLITLALYHTVQLRLGLEGYTVLVNNLGQLGVTFIVGLVCCWLVKSYRALYQEKASLALSRHQLLLSLTHEIRSPLFAVRGIVRNLSRNIERLSPQQVQQQLSDAQAAIASVNQDVEGLTQVFRGDLHEVEPQMGEADAHELVTAVVKRHPPEFRTAHTITARVSDTVTSLWCDRLLTVQILDNLVSNSLRHTLGGEVTIAISPAGDEIRCRVSDDGPGILPADRQRIFGRYQRGSQGGGSGFGVGLYLVDVYARVQGGRVEVDEVPDGASFSLYLPRGMAR